MEPRTSVGACLESRHNSFRNELVWLIQNLYNASGLDITLSYGSYHINSLQGVHTVWPERKPNHP